MQLTSERPMLFGITFQSILPILQGLEPNDLLQDKKATIFRHPLLKQVLCPLRAPAVFFQRTLFNLNFNMAQRPMLTLVCYSVRLVSYLLCFWSTLPIIKIRTNFLLYSSAPCSREYHTLSSCHEKTNPLSSKWGRVKMMKAFPPIFHGKRATTLLE